MLHLAGSARAAAGPAFANEGGTPVHGAFEQRSELADSKKIAFNMDTPQAVRGFEEEGKGGFNPKAEAIPESAIAGKGSFDEVPGEISATLGKVVNQLDIIANSLSLLEQRVASNHTQARDVLSFFRDLNQKAHAEVPC